VILRSDVAPTLELADVPRLALSWLDESRERARRLRALSPAD